MALTESTIEIPWNPAVRVPAVAGVEARLSEVVPASLRPLVPRSVLLLRDPDASPQRTQEALDALCSFVRAELSRWAQRAERFVELGLFRRDEIFGHITAHDEVHPWAVCATEAGGLAVFRDNSVPCIAVKNHAIAWLPTAGPEAPVSYLVTARAEGQPWDPEDLGHECGHATTFAIPLCAQDGGVVEPLPSELDAQQLTADHIRKIHYTLAEGANASIRGETRANETGFTVLHTAGELRLFLNWCERLFPGLGFAAARTAYDRWGQSALAMDHDIAFQVGAPFVRATGRLRGNLRKLGVPTLAWLV